MNERTEALGTEPVGKLLYKMALPSFFGLMVGALFSLVDAVFIGQALGPFALGGMAIAGPVMAIITAIGDMIGAGSASVLSRALGAKDYEKAKHVIGNAFSTTIITSLAITVLGIIFIHPLLSLFGASPSIAPYAKKYIEVIILFNVGIGFVSATNNLVAAEGNAKIANIAVIIGMLVNLGLDPLFLFVFRMGMEGPAIATIIGYTVGGLIFLIYILRGNSILKVKIKYLLMNWKIIFEIFKIGTSSFIRQISSSVVAIVINNHIKRYGGDMAFAVYGALEQIMMFLFLPALSVVEGMLPIVGFNFGAKKFGRVFKTVKLSMISAVLISLIGYTIGMLFPNIILSLFSTDKTFIETGILAVRIVLCAIPAVMIQIIGGGIYQSFGKPKEAIIISLSNDILFLIPVSFFLSHFLGLIGVWIAFPVTDILSALLTAWLLKKEDCLKEGRKSISKQSIKSEIQP
jgi:putative MATE family efflux protein